MTKKLVFIHGRSQQGKDSLALKKEWIASFREGLAKQGLQLPIDEAAIRFPYYGDTLDQLVAGADPADAARVVIRGDLSPTERDYIRALLEEIRKKAGITDAEIDAEIAAEVVERGPLNWPWVQAILKVIDRKVPFGSSASVALFTKDVFDYLTKGGIRDIIETGVIQAIQPNEPTVIVAHSLGTIVAYNILRREGKNLQWNIPLLVTVGSPLGVEKIRRSIAPTTYPECVNAWFNAFDKRDVVALYPLQDPHFMVGKVIINNSDVKNHTENRHGIAGYLDDPVVAKTIYDALL
ncbi:serine peptidase [Opitutaceae bacterium TAV5]|nr:serine peptidase [Opitutaceae bacterium TAV5]